MAKTKAYKTWENRAAKVYEKKLKSAKSKGLYENFGQKEADKFYDKLEKDNRLTYSEKIDLRNSLSDRFGRTSDRDIFNS